MASDENPRGVGPDRLRIRLGVGATGNPEGVASTPRRRASTLVASPTPNPADREQSPQATPKSSPKQSKGTPNPSHVSSSIDPSGGRRGGADVHDIVLRLYDIIQSANDKEAVRTAVYAALYKNATMSSKPLPPSSKNEEIEEVIAEFEGDADLSSEIEDKLKQQGARRRKTKKSKRKARKTRKYSRRR